MGNSAGGISRTSGPGYLLLFRRWHWTRVILALWLASALTVLSYLRYWSQNFKAFYRTAMDFIARSNGEQG